MKKKMISLVLATILLVGLSFTAEAQNYSRGKKKKSAEPETPLIDKLWFGTGFGLGLTSNTFRLELSPSVGYKLTPSLSAGIRVPFEYNYQKLFSNTGQTYKFNAIDVGVGGFGRVRFLKDIFAHVEYNYLWVKEPVTSGGNVFIDPDNPEKILTENLNRDQFNIGLGYTSGRGTVGYEMSLLYDVLNDPNSIDIPWTVRIGLNFNF